MPDEPKFDPSERIADELKIPLAGVRAVSALLAEGASVPFIARYRKEQTGELDEVQIRAIEEKRAYYIELYDRRTSILAEIEKQGKLTPELRARIEAGWVKADLEDLYLPYKPKRRTRAMIARERGLEPLALRILAQPDAGDPAAEAAPFVDEAKEVPDVKAALAPYTLNGPHGHLLDAHQNMLSNATWQTFEMAELMSNKAALAPVLTYIFRTLEKRFDGRPTLLVLDEAWLFLDQAFP